MNENIPHFLVSIQCMTYNHAPYIEDAMDGFCIQQTAFPYIAIICDDASTDGESDVIKKYLDKHFDDITSSEYQEWEDEEAFFIYTRHQTNSQCYFFVIFLKENYYSQKKDKPHLWQEVEKNSKYIALCEGDDYWTESLKLQKQVEILEDNPNYGMVYTDVHVYIQKDNVYKKSWCAQSTFENMLISNKVCTLSVVCRKDMFMNYIDEIKPQNRDWLMGDYPMWLYFFANSSPIFIDEIAGVYRVLNNSASHHDSFSKREAFILSSYEIVCFFAKQYGRDFLLKKLVNDEVNMLIDESMVYGENTTVNFARLFMEYRLFDVFLYIRSVLTHRSKSRLILKLSDRVFSSLNFYIRLALGKAKKCVCNKTYIH